MCFGKDKKVDGKESFIFILEGGDIMKKLLKKCPKCSEYSLQETCPKCNEKTLSPHPAKFSPDDKYSRLRIAEKYD